MHRRLRRLAAGPIALALAAALATSSDPALAQFAVPAPVTPAAVRGVPAGPSVGVERARTVRIAMAPGFAGNVIKSVTDVNGGNLQPGDTLEYVISATNVGSDPALFVVFLDPIPAQTTYAAGSLRILSGANAGAKSDATGDDQAQYDVAQNRVRFRLGTGATGSVNGTLAAGASTSWRFRVVVSAGAANGTTISNSGTLVYTDGATGNDLFQGSLPPGGPPGGAPTTITITTPDLTIAKSHSGSFQRGQPATYTLQVRNIGNGPTTAAATVSDVLPAGLVPTAATGTGWSCSIGAQTVSCTHAATIAAGATAPAITLDVLVDPAAPGSLTNTATVAGGGETNTGNNSASDPTTIVDPVVDLAIVKTAGSPTFTVGSSATYTLDVRNTSALATIAPVTVTDVLPVGLTYVSAAGTGWSCGHAAGTVTCTTPGPVAGGAALPGITLTVDVGPTAAPSVTNVATVATTGDGVPGNDQSSVTTPVGGAAGIDLALAKSHSGNFVVGSTHAFTLTVQNVGTLPTTGPITITDVLPGSVALASSSGAGWSCSNVTVTVTCVNAGPLAAGASSTVTLNVNINPGAYPGFTNTASVATPGDTDPGNNTASDPVVVETVDLTITKSATSPVTIGAIATYELVVANLSALPSNRLITVTDTLPTGLTFVSATGAGWTCSHASGRVTCTNPGPVAGGSPASPIVLSVSVTPAAAPSVTNRAWVRMVSDLVTANDGASVTTPVTAPAPDLTITKVAAGPFVVGANAAYTLGVDNIGSAATTGTITVTDVLPAGLGFVSATGSGWSCSAAAGTVSCTTAGPLAAGGSLPLITLTVAVSAPAAPSVTNMASVGTPGDADPGNDAASVTTPVSATTALDLAVAKAAITPLVVGTQASYRIGVTNVSPATTTGPITVTDVLPAGLTYVSASGAGFTCSELAGTVSCVAPGPLAPAQSAAVTLTVLVGPAALPQVTNVARVATPGDANPANDQASVGTPVLNGVDLALGKVAGPLVTGGIATFTLTVENVGTGASTGPISVVDNLPPGTSFVSATGPGFACGATGALVSCTRSAPLAPGASAAITLRALVTAPAGGALTNTATVATQGDTNLPNNTASTGTIPVTPPAPDVAIAKRFVGPVVAGRAVTFAIDLENRGGGPTLGPTTVTDVLEPDLAYVSATGPGWSCSAAAQVVTCVTSALLAPGARSSITLVATLSPGSTRVRNAATVVTPDDADPSNDSAETEAVTPGVAPDLGIAKAATGAVEVGVPATYTLTVTNVGDGPTIGATTVTDVLPPSLTFVGAAANGWSCSATGQVVTCQLAAPIPPATTHVISLAVLPGAGAIPSVTNSATVETPGDQNAGNDRATVVTPVGGRVDLVLAKLGPDSVTIGGLAEYTLTVHNAGTLAPSGPVTVTDTLPAGLAVESITSGDFSCNVSGAIVTCVRSAPPLAPGTPATITIVARVSAAATSPLANRACVETPGDAVADNDCAGTTAVIAGGVDLVMTKDIVGAFTVGADARYLLGVRNVGARPAAGTITVVDTLPAGLAFVGATGDGWMCAAADNVVTCLRSTALAPGASSRIDLTVRVAAPAVPGVTNCAVVAGTDETGSRVNNTACVGATIAGTGTLRVDKRVSREEVEVGELLDYTVVVRNTGAHPVPEVQLGDTLPVAFSYVPASVRVDGRPVSEPAGAPGPVLQLSLGALAPGRAAVVTYRVRVGSGARMGRNINVAVASSPAAGVAPALATVATRVVRGFFDERGAIVGKVYLACRCSGEAQDSGDVGIPGVRVYLEDGRSAVTDEEGKYSFYDVSSRLHVVKVDRASLPALAKLTPLGSRAAGDGYTRFADVKAGELHRADFAERSGAVAVWDAVRLRRRAGEVRHAGDSLPTATSAAGIRASGGGGEAYVPLLTPRTLGSGNSALPHTPLRARVEQRSQRGVSAGRVELELPRESFPADGRADVPVTVRLFDAAGRPIRGMTSLLLEASVGRWEGAGALEAAGDGWQVTVVDGEGTFRLAAPNEGGRGEVRASTAEAEAMAVVTFVPALRPLTVTGLLNARIDFRALLAGDAALSSDEDGFEETLRDWSSERPDGSVRTGARGALFLKGTVAGDRVLTLGYDSERDRSRTYFRDIRPDEGYPTYGDAGIREFDAQSRRRFHARLDRGATYTLFGDFQTAAADDRRMLSAYDRTLTGAVQHLEGGRGRATLFASQGRVRQVIDELPGRGISGPYDLSRPDGLVNSERVELLTRDRNQPSVILRRVAMTRFADYTIEAATGRLLFRAPVPSADANLNPVSIRITYEAESMETDRFWVYGGDASVRLSDGLEVGGTVARDENPLDPSDLLGVNASASLGRGTLVLGEWARSTSGAVEGDASRLELRHQSARLEGRAFAVRSDSGFGNRSSTFFGGRAEYGGRFQAQLRPALRLVGEALHTEDRVRDGARDGMLLAVERRLGRAWRAELGYRYARESGVQSPGQSAFIPVDRDVSALRARLGWTLPEQARTALFAEYERDVRDDGYRAALGGEYLVAHRTRLYGRHEWLSSFEGPYAINGDRTQQYSVFGIDADYLRNTRMFSEYRARDAFAGRDAEASIGLRNRWTLAPGLVANSSFERVAPLFGGTLPGIGGTMGDALAVTGAVEWTRPALWKGTARLEFRDATAGENVLASLGYARKLSRDWTMLGRTMWDVADLANRQTRGWSQLGLAWRETDRNRWNGLLRYEHRVNHVGASGGAPGTETVANIVAALINHRTTDRLTLAGRYAFRASRDEVGALASRGTAQLWMGRGIVDLTRRVDAGIIGSLLATDGLASRRYGLGGELGLLVMKNLRVAGGYNLFGFTDRDLDSFGTTRRGAYLELGFKFDEALFGASRCDGGCPGDSRRE